MVGISITNMKAETVNTSIAMTRWYFLFMKTQYSKFQLAQDKISNLFSRIGHRQAISHSGSYQNLYGFANCKIDFLQFHYTKSLHLLHITYLFTFSKGSDEDGLGGRLQATEAFLQRDGSSTIRVTGIVIPNYPHGTKATYTLTVSRDSPIGPVKRSAQQGIQK